MKFRVHTICPQIKFYQLSCLIIWKIFWIRCWVYITIPSFSFHNFTFHHNVNNVLFINKPNAPFLILNFMPFISKIIMGLKWIVILIIFRVSLFLISVCDLGKWSLSMKHLHFEQKFYNLFAISFFKYFVFLCDFQSPAQIIVFISCLTVIISTSCNC